MSTAAAIMACPIPRCSSGPFSSGTAPGTAGTGGGGMPRPHPHRADAAPVDLEVRGTTDPEEAEPSAGGPRAGAMVASAAPGTNEAAASAEAAVSAAHGVVPAVPRAAGVAALVEAAASAVPGADGAAASVEAAVSAVPGADEAVASEVPEEVGALAADAAEV